MEKKTKENLIKENKYLRNIIANMPGHVYWFDTNNTFLGCNSNQAQTLAVSSPDEIIGKTPYDFISKERADKLIGKNKEVMKKKKILTFEETFKFKDGREINFISQKVPLYDEKSKVIGLLGISTDVTDRVKLEEELKNANKEKGRLIIDMKKSEREKQALISDINKAITGELINPKDITEKHIKHIKEYFENIIALTPGHVYWKGKNGKYLGCNANLAKAIGLSSRSEIVGMTNEDVANKLNWHTKVFRLLNETDMKVIDSGDPIFNVEIAIPFFGANGKTEQYMLLNKVPLKNQNNKIIGVLGISIDITDRKKMMEDLKKAKELAETANEVKTDFLHNMRHDIRTPLGNIVGVSEIMLSNNNLLPTEKEYLGHIYESAKRILDLLTNILEYTNIESGKHPVLFKKFSLRDTIEDVKNIMAIGAKQKGLDFIIEFDNKVPGILIGDQFRIHRILLNLITNAIKFTEKGYVKIAIKPAYSNKKDIILELLIEDTGIGIPEEKYNVIFEQFSRLTNSYSGVYRGVGLGLRVVKQFAEEIKAEIEVKSKLGKGSKFILLVPFKKPLLTDKKK